MRRTATLVLLVATVAVASSAVLRRQGLTQDPHLPYTRFELPAFDAYVYVAMAERPSVFTLAPWGYRLGTPALVGALPGANVVRGFRLVTVFGLILSAALLFLWLQRLGHRPWLAALTAAAFAFSAPVVEAARYPFLAEPLAVCLELLFLLAVTVGAPATVLAALAVLAVLAKDLLLVFLPLCFLDRLRRSGFRAAARDLTVVAVPAALAWGLLHLQWAPRAEGGREAGSWLGFAVVAVAGVASAWRQWWLLWLLGGLTPLALVGAVRRPARELLLTHGYALPVLLSLPLAAAVYGGGPLGGGEAVPFFARDVPRLLIYAWPLLAAFALAALPGAPSMPRPGPLASGRMAAVAGAVATIVLLGALAASLDPYRRLDLRGPRDGPFVLATCRESLRVASRLAGGSEVRWEAGRQVFVWGETDSGRLDRMRWFLREGWGERPQYGSGSFAMAGPRATLLLPWLAEGGWRAVEVMLRRADAGEAPPARLSLFANGAPVGAVVLATGAAAAVEVPTAALLRGDNVLTLLSAEGTGPTLQEIGLRPLR